MPKTRSSTRRAPKSSRSSSPRAALPALPKNRTTIVLITSLVIVLLYAGSWLVRDLSKSLFWSPPDRVNIVVYDEVPTFYSFGVREVGNYALPLYPDLRIQIPGGYGFYRVGALGKLIQLEDDPDLLRRSFAAVSSSFVTFYFYHDSEEVFYGDKSIISLDQTPSLHDILFMDSNASLADRIFILALLNSIKPNTVDEISSIPYDQVKDDTIFDPITFFETLIGSFYQTTYRNENLNVQIMYTNSYQTADTISSILNGNGIIVGDLTNKDSDQIDQDDCTVIEETQGTKSYTARSIADYFGCRIETGQTGIYDIQFVLGPLEEEWAVE